MSAEDDVLMVFIYRCRKCRFNLEITDAVLESNIGRLGDCSLSKTTIDLEPDLCPAWISDAVNQSGWTKGKLKCEKCCGRLGSFDFVKDNSCEGQNGRHQHSAVHLNRDRVDVLKTSSRSFSATVTDSNMGKLTLCDRQARHSGSFVRNNVGKRTKDSIDNIKDHDAELQRYTDTDNQSLYYGAYCSAKDETDSDCGSLEKPSSVKRIKRVKEFDGNLNLDGRTLKNANSFQGDSSHIIIECDFNPGGENSYEKKFKQSTDNLRLQGKICSSYLVADENLQSFYAENACVPVAEDVHIKSYADSVKYESVLKSTQRKIENIDIGAFHARNNQGNKIPSEENKTIKEKSNAINKSILMDMNHDHRVNDLIPIDDNLYSVPKGKQLSEPVEFVKSEIKWKTICDKMDAPAEPSGEGSKSGQKALEFINFQNICDKMDTAISEDRKENPKGISDIDTFDNIESEVESAENELRLIQEGLLDREYLQEMEYDSRKKRLMSKDDNIMPGPSSYEDGSAVSNSISRSKENRFLALECDEPTTDEDSQNQNAVQKDEMLDPQNEVVKRRRARRRGEKRQRNRYRLVARQDDDTDYRCPPIEELLEDEDVPNEMSCPVCLEILFSPYKCRPCNHVFCEICLRRIARQQPNCTLCPMCRKVIRSCVSDSDLGRQLCDEYPRLYKRRQAEMQRTKVYKLPLPRSSWREMAFRNVSFRLYYWLFLPVLLQILRPGVWRFIPGCCFCAFVFGLITMLCFIVLIFRFMLRSTYEFAVHIFS